jgi:beta-barrel assembly-enhancing protease
MYRRSRGGCGSGAGRLLIALVLVGVALFTYFGQRVYNPVTDETQHISISPQQEVALGLQAAPQMEREFGGQSQDGRGQALVDEVCTRIVQSSAAGQTDYPFECHLLGDPETINAFALPGGQVFITEALFRRIETEGQLAGILGHEIAHVVARHGAEHIAKTQLTQDLTGAVVVASYDPNNPNSAYAAQFAALIGQLVNMKYGRDDELESDRLGVRFMKEAGYDPRAMLRVMEILAESSSGGRPPEFFSTHPNPENRLERIQEAIGEEFPNGVPEGLIQ